MNKARMDELKYLLILTKMKQNASVLNVKRASIAVQSVYKGV
jgi:hypothetical protein